MKRAALCLFVLVAIALFTPSSALALDDAHHAKAQKAIAKAIEFLRQKQNANGSWTPQPGPAVTALVVQGMLKRPDISPADPAMKKAIDYILSKAKDDGSIQDGILMNYNTAIALSALANVTGRPDVSAAVTKAQNYLRDMQWHNQKGPDGKTIDKSHPFYGGSGYGKHGRPDLSNTQFMLEGLHESGLDCNDPAFQRALVFISRCQAADTNDAPWRNKLANDGGFVYTTSESKDKIGVPGSEAGEETLDIPGQGSVSVLRSYGSMTYAGFKSYLYANLSHDDPRVVNVLKWVRNNYAVDKNPGMAAKAQQQGLYYYLLTFTRAMHAWGSTTITTADGQSHDWANDLVDQLVKTQHEDGSWSNDADRWMEGDPNLVTAYSLLCLTTAAN
jgi:squalene-hopene/tetraprenyl-beta-curcumene cyclase